MIAFVMAPEANQQMQVLRGSKTQPKEDFHVHTWNTVAADYKVCVVNKQQVA